MRLEQMTAKELMDQHVIASANYVQAVRGNLTQRREFALGVPFEELTDLHTYFKDMKAYEHELEEIEGHLRIRRLERQSREQFIREHNPTPEQIKALEANDLVRRRGCNYSEQEIEQ